MGTMVQINRDSFARASLMRRVLTANNRGACKWCGQPGSKYEYAWVADSIFSNRAVFRGPFCGVSCYRTYHNQEGGR